MIDIVMSARSLGIYTLVVDKDPSSPAKLYADKFFDISTDEIEKIEKICRVEGVNGIFTGFEDFNIHIACTLCSRLHFPFYGDEKLINTITNKIKFKQRCREFGVPVIEQFSYDEAMNKAEYPYIVKPADSYGSRGISICRDAKELALSYRKAYNSSSTGSVILERFIDSDHGVELFYTAVKGHYHLTATADRYTTQNNETNVPLPIAEVFPSRHRDDLVKNLDSQIRKLLTGLGIQNGLVLIQALYSEVNNYSLYHVYEMAFRLTGEQHYLLAEKQHGINFGKMMIKLALGENIENYDTDVINDINFTKPSINLAIILNSGKIKYLSRFEEIKNIKEIVSYNITNFKHNIVNLRGDYSSIFLRINMVAENYENLNNAIREVYKYLHVISDTNEDMIATRFYLTEEMQ